MGLFSPRKVFTDNSFQYVIEVDLQLQSYRAYIYSIGEVIEKEIVMKIEEYKRFLRDSDNYEIENCYNYEDHQIKIYTHQLYFDSLFISIYSFFEKKMFQLCKIAEKNQSLKINDLSGVGIVKYENYMRKVLFIDVKIVNNEWGKIKKYNKLRNKLVHSPTNIVEKSNSNLKLINTLNSVDYLTIIDNDDYIEFEISDKKMLLDFCSIISKYLENIYYEKH